MTKTLVKVGAAAALLVAASTMPGRAADDTGCFTNPTSCAPPTPVQTCLINGQGPAPRYASYGNYFAGQHPLATLSPETRADVLTLMNNAAQSWGFPGTDPDINFQPIGDAQGGYYKWYPHPGHPTVEPYGFGIVYWNNTTGCAYFMSNSVGFNPYTSPRILEKYGALSYERGGLGLPTSNPVMYSTYPYNTTWQRFTNGYITYRPGDIAAFYVGGSDPAMKAVARRYGSDFDRAPGLNPYPLSMDIACHNSLSGITCPPRFSYGYYVRTNDGQRTILARKYATTAYMVGGDPSNRALAQKWYAKYGAAPWTGALGYPKGEEAIGVDGVGRSQLFEGGDLLWTPASGAHVVVNGPIRDEWNRLGREAGSLGYPVQDTPPTATVMVHEFMKGRIRSTGQETASISDSNGWVPNVKSAFVNIPTGHARLSFYSVDPETGYDHMQNVSLVQHIQGAQRVGRNRFVLTSSHDAEMYFATLGSRETWSAHQRWGNLTPDPNRDHAYSTLRLPGDRPHFGGIQAVGDFVFAVAADEWCFDYDPFCSTAPGTYFTLVDSNPPASIMMTHWFPDDTFSAVGATRRLDGTYLLAFLGAKADEIRFYDAVGRTNPVGSTGPLGPASLANGLELAPLYHWTYAPDTTFLEDGRTAYGEFYNYQSINLVTQQDGQVFLVGTEQHGVPAEDWAHLWRVDACNSGRQPSCSCSAPTPDPARLCLTSLGRKHMYLSDDVYGDFDGGAGVYINPLGGPRDLFLYSTEKSNGGVHWGISEF